MPKFILAGNGLEFQDYMAKHKKILRDLREVKNLEKTRNLRRVKICCIGTWDKRPDILDLIAQLRGNGCIFTYEEEKQNESTVA